MKKEMIELTPHLKKLIENDKTQLGKKTLYKDTYDPELIFPVSRKESRERIGDIDYFVDGIDIWNSYEFSALYPNGLPYCKTLMIAYDMNSESIVESKSLKLYLNSFNGENIEPREALETIKKDLEEKLKTNWIRVEFRDCEVKDRKFLESIGENLTLTPGVDYYEYSYNPELLRKGKDSGIFYFDSFKSNCRHSGLPDWGTMMISIEGKGIDRESLLQYLVSFRNHREFHEECVERVLHDIGKRIKPDSLTVCCNYTRRGGIDINPIRKAYEAFYSYDEIYESFARNINQ